MTEQEKAQMENRDKFLAEVKRLAALDKIDYELIRDKIADQFKARVSSLDEFVDDERKQLQEHKSGIGLFPTIKPWDEPVTLSLLLDEIVNILNRYVSFNSIHEPRTIALWVIHTYCIEVAYITPVLFITSAEMRSGKSTLLSIIQKIVFKCLAASSVSPSVIYRVIPKHHPTLIFDEADTYLTPKNEDLRGVINAGHSRSTSGILRTNPDTLEPERFDAFSAKCFAAIKELPNTIEDRSIIVKMRRMARGLKKEKMRLINEQLRKEFQNIQRKCIRFTDDNIAKLKTINPRLPDALNDRAADNWHVLFQIAELAGNEWLQYAIEAALILSGIEEESKSLGIELLEDIRNLFDGIFKYYQSVPTSELIDTLCVDDEAPWATYNSRRQDTTINSRQLAKLLAPYGIQGIKNIGDKKLKGYSKISFQDAFSRYLYPDTTNITAISATSAMASNHVDYTSNENNNSFAPSRSICSDNEVTTTFDIAGADNSGLEQKQKIAETYAHQGVAARADKNNHDEIDDCIYV